MLKGDLLGGFYRVLLGYERDTRSLDNGLHVGIILSTQLLSSGDAGSVLLWCIHRSSEIFFSKVNVPEQLRDISGPIMTGFKAVKHSALVLVHPSSHGCLKARALYVIPGRELWV